MEWISVIDKEPKQDRDIGRYILILVNHQFYLCYIPPRETCIFITDNKFIYTDSDKWFGDNRFAKPTHWMEIPEQPK